MLHLQLMMPKAKSRLEVCASPALIQAYDVSHSMAVIIDVLRATSTICTALFNGAEKIIPVASVEDCIRIGHDISAITAGERDGHIAEGLQHGNSPFEYPREFIKGKTIVLTTTNGTRLLNMVAHAAGIVTGSFPNLSAVCDYLTSVNMPVILCCAAWKDRINLEDMLFAGAVVNKIKKHFDVNCDTALIAEKLYLEAKDDLFTAMKSASHFQRLARYGLEKDIRYCLTADVAPSLPVLEDGALVDKR